MRWIVDGCAILTAVAGVWLLVPTMWTFLGPDFGPTPRNDAIVFQAEQTGHP
jgi:hypothetical protein